MFFIWGSGGGRSEEGNLPEVCQCDTCKNITKMKGVIYYRYFHLWYLFSFLTSKKYVYECSHCNNGYQVSKEEFSKYFKKNHIPFIRKLGWLIVVAIIAAFIVFGSYSSSQHQAQIQSYLVTPLENDRYLANLAQIDNSGYDDQKKAYGILKLQKVLDNDKYYFTVSTQASNKKSGLNKMLERNSIKYDENDVITLTKEQITSLKDKNIIYDIIRN